MTHPVTPSPHPFDPDQIGHVWQIISDATSRTPYNWTIRPAAQSRLLKLLPDTNPEIFKNDPAALNLAIRVVVGPPLRQSPPLRRLLSEWIVRDWGGIRRNNPATIKSYLDAFGDFSPVAIQTAIPILRMGGISSWSKIIAFAHPDKFAVFDSRVAAALNAALIETGAERLFVMPAPNGHGPVAAFRTRTENNANFKFDLGYTKYLAFLDESVRAGYAGDILTAEMAIFSAADICCQDHGNGL